MITTRLKKGDTIIVNSGKFRGKIDSVKSIIAKNDVLFLNSLSFIKKVKNDKGKFSDKEVFIPLKISKVSYFSREDNCRCKIIYSLKLVDGRKIKERKFIKKGKVSSPKKDLK